MSITRQTGVLVLVGGLWLSSVPVVSEPLAARVEDALAPVKLTSADHGKTNSVVVGQRIIITMRGVSGTGYSWYNESKTSVVKLLEGEGPEKKGIPAKPDRPSIPGGGRGYTAVFKAVEAGKGAIVLEYKRIWEKKKDPAETILINLLVKSRSGPLQSK